MKRTLLGGAIAVLGLACGARSGLDTGTEETLDETTEPLDPTTPTSPDDPPAGPLEPVELALGNGHACARFGNGGVKCWGSNEFGQLGLGDTQDRGIEPGSMGANLPVVNLGEERHAIRIAAGNQSTCALLDDGTIKCWGANSFGMLGLGDMDPRGGTPETVGDNLETVALGTGRTAVQIGVGNHHVCALLDDASVKCWGERPGLETTDVKGSAPGTMGDALQSVRLGTNRTAKQLAVGFNSTCAILDDHSLKCWGSNGSGQLATGDRNDRGSWPGTMGDALLPIDLGEGRTAVSVAPSSYSTCAVLDTHEVKCWGAAADLGLAANQDFGALPGTMGDALPAVDLGTGRTVLSASSGARFTCALLDDATVKCWGYNPGGQLGVEDYLSRGDDEGEMGDSLPAVRLGTGASVLQVTSGAFFNCAILSDRTVKCWGQNVYGELGQEDTFSRGGFAASMGDHLPPVRLW